MRKLAHCTLFCALLCAGAKSAFAAEGAAESSTPEGASNASSDSEASAIAPADEKAASEASAVASVDTIPGFLVERIEIRGNRRTARGVIEAQLGVKRGDRLTADDPRIAQARIHLLGLGYFVDVDLAIAKGSRRGRVVLFVRVSERSTLVINSIFLGNSRAVPWWAGFDVTDTNFAGQGIGLGTAFLSGANSRVQGSDRSPLAVRAELTARRFALGRFVPTAQFLYARGVDFYRSSGDAESTDLDGFTAFNYRRVGGQLALGLDWTRAVRGYFGARLERIAADLPAVIQREYVDGHVEQFSIDVRDGDSSLASFIIGLERDTRSDPVLPRSGSRFAAVGEVSALDYSFFKATLLAEGYRKIGASSVLGLRAGLGRIYGNAPFFDRYYVGDLAKLIAPRALGLALAADSPHDFLGSGIDEQRYGVVAVSAGIEIATSLFRRGKRVFGGDFFVGAGIWGVSDNRTLTGQTHGAAALPLDVNVDVGFRLDTSIGVFELSLANVLGRLPR